MSLRGGFKAKYFKIVLGQITNNIYMWDWQSFFVKIGIPTSISSRYAEIFRQNRVSKDMLPDLDKATLADLGVTAVGDQLAILRHAKDEAYEMEADSPAKLRVHIPGPGKEKSLNGSTSNEIRKGRPPPDRHEIYHIKMPEGSTARTKQIMQNASMMRKHGLVARGTTGVRQGGRSVSPIDKRSAAVIRMRQERESAKVNDPIITRLGVRGLHSDETAVRPISGRVQKRSVQRAAVGTSRFYEEPEIGDDVAIRVQIPSRNGAERRVAGKAKSRVTTSIANRISRSSGNGIPRVTVKLRGSAPTERLAVRNARTIRKPVHARLSTVAGGGKTATTSRPVPIRRPIVQPEYLVDEEELSAEEEEYVEDDMVWDDALEDEDVEDQYEEEIEYMDGRPSVYHRLSR
ncbi:Sterile alpha motif containing protein [Trichostrongylus colubriformis]|uniref:Sterile alpha motif containing protein n=1 Tax=Trichostrongylus colubriformis TaxID=6319 RepID=A0AAN8FPL2_TRICO